MTEALVTSVVAVLTAGAALNNRLHNRINSVHERISALDRRLDGIELTVASDYVKKSEKVSTEADVALKEPVKKVTRKRKTADVKEEGN